MDLNTRLKLSGMMFLQYFIWGSWYVTMGTYLGEGLGFSGSQIGLAYGTTAIGAMISPFFVGMIADRFFPAQKVLSALHLIGGVLLYLAVQQTSFVGFYSILIAHTLCYMPTLALTNSVSFNQMSDTAKQFPAIRVLGTIGWIAQGWVISLMGIEAEATPFLIGAGVSIALGIYCLFLPNTPPASADKEVTAADVIGLDALSMFKNRSFAVFVISSMLICIPLSFYYGFTNLFLNELDVSNAAGKMTFGQMSEIFFMLVMPFFFRRLGVKYMLVVGILAWATRYFLFAFGNNDTAVWMLLFGIILHGVCYDFFFVTGQIYVDKKASDDIRSKAQGLITFATLGVGMFIGTWLSGKVVENYATAEASIPHDWKAIWMVPGILSLVLLVAFWALFKDKVDKDAEA